MRLEQVDDRRRRVRPLPDHLGGGPLLGGQPQPELRRAGHGARRRRAASSPAPSPSAPDGEAPSATRSISFFFARSRPGTDG